MNLITPLLAEAELEGRSTLRVLERVPADKLDWRPHAKSMSLGQLASHLANIPRTVIRLLEAGEFDLSNARPAPQSSGTAAADFEQNLADMRSYMQKLDDATLLQKFTLRKGDQVIQQFPKIGVLRNIFLNHSIHHRGQLSVYLRLLDVPVPAVYGTSADEAM